MGCQPPSWNPVHLQPVVEKFCGRGVGRRGYAELQPGAPGRTFHQAPMPTGRGGRGGAPASPGGGGCRSRPCPPNCCLAPPPPLQPCLLGPGRLQHSESGDRPTRSETRSQHSPPLDPPVAAGLGPWELAELIASGCELCSAKLSPNPVSLPSPGKGTRAQPEGEGPSGGRWTRVSSRARGAPQRPCRTPSFSPEEAGKSVAAGPALAARGRRL